MFSNFFFFQNRTVYETMWQNIVDPGRQQMTIWRMRIPFWIPKATNTHSQCVILTAVPQQLTAARTRLNVTFIRTLLVLF